MRQRHRFDHAAINVDVGQDRRRGIVIVPEGMVHQLVMPLALPGFQINTDEALGKQVVSRPMSAVVIR